ncbi:MAG: hypothetical protein AB7S65_13245 [Sulfuricurvum sp.]
MIDFAVSENTFFEAFNNSHYSYRSINDPENPERFIIIISETDLSQRKCEKEKLLPYESVLDIDKAFQMICPKVLPVAVIIVTEKKIAVLNRLFMVTVITDTFEIEEYPAQADPAQLPVEYVFEKQDFSFFYLSNTSELINFAKMNASRSIFMNKVIKHYSKISPISNTLFFMVNNLFHNMVSKRFSYRIPATKISIEQFQLEFDQLLIKRSDIDE